MTIMICIGRLYMGGIEQYAIDLALGLQDKGHDVFILVFYSVRNAEKLSDLRGAGIKVFELGLQSGKDLRLPLTFLKIMKTVKPDVVHFNVLPVLAFLALSVYNTTTIYTIHQITSNKIISRIYKYYLDGIIAISEKVKSILHEDEKIFDANEWAIINNGIELKNSQVIWPENKEINLIMVSRLAQDKHPDDAIEIINYLVKNSDLKYNLIFVGDGDVDDATYLENLHHKVKKYGLEDRIRFAGWQENVNPYLNISHGFLMLSRLECFPYSVIEALSAGLPVFSYRIKGGLHDMHENNITGIVTEARDPIELAREIAKVFRQPERWQEMSDNAFATSKRFSVEEMVNKTEFFYRTLIGNKYNND